MLSRRFAEVKEKMEKGKTKNTELGRQDWRGELSFMHPATTAKLLQALTTPSDIRPSREIIYETHVIRAQTVT